MPAQPNPLDHAVRFSVSDLFLLTTSLLQWNDRTQNYTGLGQIDEGSLSRSFVNRQVSPSNEKCGSLQLVAEHPYNLIVQSRPTTSGIPGDREQDFGCQGRLETGARHAVDPVCRPIETISDLRWL
jgi:hypothetical protein